MSTIKRSISADSELFRLADERMRQLRYPKFSRYIQALMEADAYLQMQETHQRPFIVPNEVAKAAHELLELGIEKVKTQAHAPVGGKPSPRKRGPKA